MKKIYFLLIALTGLFLFQSCSDTETYAEKKEKENAAINQYIADKNIQVISEAEFKAQDYTTDVSKNQYVLMSSSGVYMQIIDKGCGAPIKTNETRTVLVRFDEYNLLNNPDTMQLSNNVLAFSSIVDKMTVINKSGTNTALFASANESVLASAYGSTAVPEGWLVPLNYVNIGRPTDESTEPAHVKIIVPSAKGQAYAATYTYPCLYELYLMAGK